MPQFFYGIIYNPKGILLSLVIWCLLLLGIKILAGRKNWKISKLRWLFIVLLTLITVNMIPI